MINDYKDLIVWQKSMDLTFEIYKITNNFHSYERFCLIDQMRRAVICSFKYSRGIRKKL